ncbi:MAG: methylmalonyl-CoA mutase small subunit [Sciscionella sp.]|nr:methylmalonyl-CoA mutase small subunit [Sciscionella sp.]
MTASETQLRLAGEFDPADVAQWRALVHKVLSRSQSDVDESAPESALVSHTYDGIAIQPLYTADDGAPSPGWPGLPPFVRGGRPDGTARGWDVRQRYANPDAAAVNAAMLADLAGGSTSVWLAVGRDGITVNELPRALDGVLLDLAPVVLDAGAGYPDAARALFAQAEKTSVPQGKLRGNLGIDPIGERARTGRDTDIDAAAAFAVEHTRQWPGLRAITVDALAYHDAGGSEGQELGCSIAAGVAYLRALTAAGLDVASAAGQLEFRYAATVDQFLTIAKLRAARRLWARVTQVCGCASAQSQHAVTSSAMMTEYDPWVNMLRTTVAAFAAGVGGADAITVRPFDAAIGFPNEFSARIARNTQTILLEESRLANVIDPAGGSWYVERLTDELTRVGWNWFTEIERAGGIVAALDSGLIRRRLAETFAARSANIAHRIDPITGVSEFPDLAAKPVVRQPFPPTRSDEKSTVDGGLPSVRYAGEFQRLRTSAARHAQRNGATPSVFLATIGPLSAHTARATFAVNLFAAGGIETTSAGPTESIGDIVAEFEKSGEKIACICGTDSAYDEFLGELPGALKKAGARTILTAGKPRPDVSTVDEWVHTGCDAIAVLTRLHNELGVAT